MTNSEDMINLILFGPPGSGKGTQAERLCAKYDLEHISTGDLFRTEISNETALGLKAKSYLDQGELVPDEVTVGMFASKLDTSMVEGAKGFVFDGFPRTVAQADALNELVQQRNMSITRLLVLDVAEDELVKRLLNRGKDSGRSDDTSEELIRKRIAEYNSKTAPVAAFYEMHNLLSIIHGEGTIEEIFTKLCETIEATAEL